ncbi:solute carrier family 25 member 35-like isoform X2 [Photinus pyralis]|uniref:Solute carrier family 25 member 35 n=2 Tax=Photinus pyralis TaxID=7054 RepID=A0A1Y1NFT6_PHOPY|nr:solute carrier family 25 member 35-like isoform X2 [Photinus pyralis]
MDLLIGGIAAVGAGVFTNPLEVIKTRMQLQGELAAKGQYTVHYRNILSASYVIIKHDGILSLQAGLTPALWFQFVMNGTRLGTYQILYDKGYTKDKNGNSIFYKSVLVGGVCGMLGAWTGSPLYLVKTHLQAQAAKEIAFGHQHNHEGAWQAFKHIYNAQGIKGLFRGGASSMPRAFSGSTSQLTSFSYCKEWLLNYPTFQNSPVLTAFVASMTSGVVIGLCMTPFDLIALRLYNQGVDANGKGLLYNGYLDCVGKIWSAEGFLGFYKGLSASYIRLGPHTVLSLVFWDKLKDLFKQFNIT